MKKSYDPTTRFSDRASHYAQWRPDYPAAVADFLRDHLALSRAARIADIGSGTGILTRLLLPLAADVYAIEPNAPMRIIAEESLASHKGFHSIAATAEATTLPDSSIDLITAGQAFHWFDRDKAKAEFARVVVPGGWVALIWNERRANPGSFGQQYDTLIEEFRDEQVIDHRRNITDAELADFFAPAPMQIASFYNYQALNLDGLLGRVVSMSTMPTAAHADYPRMLARIQHLFDANQVGGFVKIEYDTRIYHGQLQ